MLDDRHARLPISTRHAFALAFDLAIRRDALHSLLVPLLLHSPWILALALMPSLSDTDRPGWVVLLTNVALLGDFIVQIAVGAMLRFRARSVFNTAADVPAAPASECYTSGLRRMPWLLVTEVVRNLLLVFGTFFFVVPAAYLGFRLSIATEAVVLSEPHTAGAFRRSFHFTAGRFERWLEMVVLSVIIALGAMFLAVTLGFMVGVRALNGLVATAQFLIAAVTPIIQYAWTFFYLRLLEIETGQPGVEVGPAYASNGGVAPLSPMSPPTVTAPSA